MTEKAKPKVDTVRLQNMSRAFIESASMFAAIDIELFVSEELPIFDNVLEPPLIVLFVFGFVFNYLRRKKYTK